MAGKFAKGTIFSVTVDLAFKAIASLTNIGGVELSADDVDATAHDSVDDYREFFQGLKDGGSVSIEGNFTNDESQTDLIDLFNSGAIVAMKIAFPNALATWTFNAYVNAFSTEAPMDDKLTFSASFKVTGKPTLA